MERGSAWSASSAVRTTTPRGGKEEPVAETESTLNSTQRIEKLRMYKAKGQLTVLEYWGTESCAMCISKHLKDQITLEEIRRNGCHCEGWDVKYQKGHLFFRTCLHAKAFCEECAYIDNHSHGVFCEISKQIKEDKKIARKAERRARKKPKTVSEIAYYIAKDVHLKVGERDPVVKRIRMMSDLGRGSVYVQCHKTKGGCIKGIIS